MMKRRLFALLSATVLLTLSTATGACRQDPATAAAAFVASGDRYVASRQFKAAILEYRNALEHQPQAASIHRKLARAYDGAGDAQKALAALAAVVGLVDDDSEANVRVAQALVAARRFEEARQIARRVPAADPRHADALIVVAAAAASLGESNAAEAALAQAFALDPHSQAGHLLKASWQVRDRRAAEARRTLQTLVSLHPDSADAWLALGSFEWQTGTVSAAEPALRRALDLHADKSAMHRVVASYLISVGRAQEAESHLQAVAEKSVADRLRLAEYYAALGRLDDADREASAVIERRKGGGAARLLRARVRYAQGRRTHADQDLDAAIRDRDVEPDARLFRSRVLLNAGDVEAALREARSVAEAHPRRSDASYAVAVAAMQKREWALATEWLERARYTSDRPAFMNLQLARVALAAGRPGDAVRYARRAAADAPAPETHALLARALRAAGDTQAASATLAQSRRRWPKAVALDLESGYLELQRKHARAAVAAFERAVHGAPESAAVITVLGMAKEQGGDLHGARAAYERALARDPRDGIAANNLAWLYAESGRLDEALVLARRAAEVLNDAPEALDTLGWVHHRAGRHDEAIRAFQAALEKRPDSPTYHHHLGIAYLRAGRHVEARASLERALQISPSVEGAAAARKMLDEMR